jgi:pimeloyl-ACP methyl ester carboxylesterase
MDQEDLSMDILLIGGLWLEASIWEPVLPGITAAGHRAVPVSVPAEPSATLDDQVAAVLAAVDAADGNPLVVGHSAAATLAWIAADRRPEKVGKVAFIGGFPNDDGSLYADFFEVSDGVMPFPGWEAFAGPDSDDLDEEARTSLGAVMVPVPEGVAKGVVHLSDERRYEVPALLICPEFSVDDAKAWIGAGDVAELAKVKHLEYVDIDSGHWPMVTKPDELARLLAEAA